jgi:hypothetical protein
MEKSKDKVIALAFITITAATLLFWRASTGYNQVNAAPVLRGASAVADIFPVATAAADE